MASHRACATPGEAIETETTVEEEPPVVAVTNCLAWVALSAYPFAVFYSMKNWGPRGGALALAALLVPATIVRLKGLDRPSIKTVAFVPLVAMAMLLVGAALNRAGFVLAVPTAVNAVLLAGFAPTLWSGPPMVERFARIQHKDLSEAEISWW